MNYGMNNLEMKFGKSSTQKQGEMAQINNYQTRGIN